MSDTNQPQHLLDALAEKADIDEKLRKAAFFFASDAGRAMTVTELQPLQQQELANLELSAALGRFIDATNALPAARAKAAGA